MMKFDNYVELLKIFKEDGKRKWRETFLEPINNRFRELRRDREQQEKLTRRKAARSRGSR